MEAKLIIIKGKANKAEVSLRLPSTIGRSREADLTIAHPMVSRQHCQLFEVGGLLKIRDLGSLNGTFLGDQQIQEADLYPNTEFSIGPLTFRVAYQYAGPVGAAPAFTPAVNQAPANMGAAVAVPDFQPAADEPIPGEPAADVSPAFAPPSDKKLPEFDAGASDVSSWGAALRDDLAGAPLGIPVAAPASGEDAVEQYAADALAEEDDGESFVGQLPAAEPVAVPPMEFPVLEMPEEPAPPPNLAPAGEAMPESAADAASNGETREPEAAAEASAKKRTWWPFGADKQKSKGEAAKAAEPAPAPDNEATLPADAEAPPDFLSVPEDSQESQPAEPPANDALNQFFKGLK